MRQQLSQLSQFDKENQSSLKRLPARACVSVCVCAGDI